MSQHSQSRPSPADTAASPAAVIVIGGANIDHKSQTFGRAVPGTSNPGRSRSSVGGVGRNVADNLGRLGIRTSLITCIGDDADGRRLVEATESVNVDLRLSIRTSGATGTYTALLDQAGDLLIAVSAMESIDELDADAIDARSDAITHARLLLLDCNIDEAALTRAGRIACEAGVRIIAEPVSVAKAPRILSLLAAGIRLHTITPNLAELRALSSSTGSSDSGLRLAAAQLHALGVDHVWIRLGVDGSFLSSVTNGEQRSEHVPVCPAKLVDAIGAGDAMLAGYVAALLIDLDPFLAARYGSAAAAITVESRQTVSPVLDFFALAARVSECTTSPAE